MTDSTARVEIWSADGYTEPFEGEKSLTETQQWLASLLKDVPVEHRSLVRFCWVDNLDGYFLAAFYERPEATSTRR